jgi:hypothetical protein
VVGGGGAVGGWGGGLPSICGFQPFLLYPYRAWETGMIQRLTTLSHYETTIRKFNFCKQAVNVEAFETDTDCRKQSNNSVLLHNNCYFLFLNFLPFHSHENLILLSSFFLFHHSLIFLILSHYLSSISLFLLLYAIDKIVSNLAYPLHTVHTAYTVKKGSRVSRPQPGCHYQTLPGRE